MVATAIPGFPFGSHPKEAFMVEVAIPAAPVVEGIPAAAPTPAVAPSVVPPTDGDRSWVPDDLRNDPSLREFKTPGDLARTWTAREKLFKDRLTGMVKLPGEGDTPEQQAAWREAIGVPKAAADYGLDVAEDLRHI